MISSTELIFSTTCQARRWQVVWLTGLPLPEQQYCQALAVRLQRRACSLHSPVTEFYRIAVTYNPAEDTSHRSPAMRAVRELS